jgi:hypothetical protein
MGDGTSHLFLVRLAAALIMPTYSYADHPLTGNVLLSLLTMIGLRPGGRNNCRIAVGVVVVGCSWRTAAGGRRPADGGPKPFWIQRYYENLLEPKIRKPLLDPKILYEHLLEPKIRKPFGSKRYVPHGTHNIPSAATDTDTPYTMAAAFTSSNNCKHQEQAMEPLNRSNPSLRHRFVRLNPRFDRDETLRLLTVRGNGAAVVKISMHPHQN